MKINLILPGIGHSGGVQMALQYIEYFTDKGESCVCYVPLFGAYYGLKKLLFLKSIFRILFSKDLQGKWIKGNVNLKFVPYISNRYIRDAKITIATSWLTSYWVYKLNEKKGKKVYFIQDYETWGNKNENQMVKKSYQLPFDLRVSVSTKLHDKLLKEDNSVSKIICNGIRRKYIKQSFNKLPRSKITIGFPYRDSRGKGKDIKNSNFALKALENYLDIRNVNIKSYGFKKPRSWNNKISFLENPSRGQLFKWYDTIDLFYVPSLYEGWGLPAMEAMARGCVVLASNTGCIYEYGQDKINCYKLRNMRSISELYKSFDKLSGSYELREKIGSNAIKTVYKYSFEKQASIFLNELRKFE